MTSNFSGNSSLSSSAVDDAIILSQPLVDFDLTGSKEIWLNECPISQFPDVEGKEFKVKIDKEGILGGFEDSSGNEVDLVSFASQDADPAVIIPPQGNITAPQIRFQALQIDRVSPRRK